MRESAGRVVVQVSLAARLGRVDWDDQQAERRSAVVRAYTSSKAALGLFATEFARRSDDEGWGVTVGISHPGVAPDRSMAARLRARRAASKRRKLPAWIGHSPDQATQSALMALTGAQRPGEMCAPGFEISGPPTWRRAYRSISDRDAGARIWGVGEQLLGDLLEA